MSEMVKFLIFFGHNVFKKMECYSRVSNKDIYNKLFIIGDKKKERANKNVKKYNFKMVVFLAKFHFVAFETFPLRAYSMWSLTRTMVV